MGWTFYRKPDNAKGELDGLFTHSNGGTTRRILDSALVNLRTYYGALEIDEPGQDRKVIAVVCLVSFNGEAGYEFGYKDMDEFMGPCEAECPERILKLLTPLPPPRNPDLNAYDGNRNAANWRETCWANITRRKAAKDTFVTGRRVRFPYAFNCALGPTQDFRVVVLPPSGRRKSRVCFTPLYEGGREGALTRLQGYKQAAVEVLA